MIILSTSDDEIVHTGDTINSFARPKVERLLQEAAGGMVHGQLLSSYVGFSKDYHRHIKATDDFTNSAFTQVSTWDQRSIIYAKILTLYDQANIKVTKRVFESMMCSPHHESGDDVFKFTNDIMTHTDLKHFKYMVTHQTGLEYYSKLKIVDKPLEMQAQFWVMSRHKTFQELALMYKAIDSTQA